MKRIAVIGSPGAGKSTISRELQSILGLPVIHLDQFFWSANWTMTESEVFRKRVAEAHAMPEWIIDGNYRATMRARLERADAVVFLDHSTRVCLWRVLRRMVSGHGKTRADIAKDCPERFDVEFVRYVISFRRKQRPGLIAELEAFPELRVFHVCNSREVGQVLDVIRGEAHGCPSETK